MEGLGGGAKVLGRGGGSGGGAEGLGGGAESLGEEQRAEEAGSTLRRAGRGPGRQAKGR